MARFVREDTNSIEVLIEFLLYASNQRFPELGKKPVFSHCRAANFGGSTLIRCGRLCAVARRETMFYLDEG